jgi:hypothetical protein
MVLMTITKVHKFMYTEGSIIVPQWLRGLCFMHTKEEPAYRLFPSEIVKLCLTLRCLC